MSDAEVPQTLARTAVVPLGTLDQAESEGGAVGGESLQESPTPVTSAKRTISRAEARIMNQRGFQSGAE